MFFFILGNLGNPLCLSVCLEPGWCRVNSQHCGVPCHLAVVKLLWRCVVCSAAVFDVTSSPEAPHTCTGVCSSSGGCSALSLPFFY